MSKQDGLPVVITKKDAVRALRRVTDNVSQTHSDSFRFDSFEEFVVDALRLEVDGVCKIGKLAGEQLRLLPDGKTQEEGDEEFRKAGYVPGTTSAVELRP